jgi:S-adenosylmethionine:tRNA ribosyltransferase-isomerase
MDIQNMIYDVKMEDYAYDLPESRIARYPLRGRDASKLLVYGGGKISECLFSDIAAHLPENSLTVRNNTQVIRARFFFRKPTGGLVEIFCLEPLHPSTFEEAFLARGGCEWICMAGYRKKWKGEPLRKKVKTGGDEFFLTARLESYGQPSSRVCFEWERPEYTFADILEAAGVLPIPPYLNRDTEESDLETYQTVYASVKGSVAAPTAGLHFTPQLLGALERRGVRHEEITLHVGAGTFMPVVSDRISGHVMHREVFSVRRSTLQSLLDSPGRITAVGTTTVRALESIYHLGQILAVCPETEPEALVTGQWDAYDGKFPEISAEEALTHLVSYLERTGMERLDTSTRLLIVPGFKFHIVNRMITNFHQPGSTLLLLVSAFTGGRWKEIYRYALDHRFRFLSYGDASLLTGDGNPETFSR